MKLSALGIAVSLLAFGPALRAADLNEMYTQLQDAVAKKDPELVKKIANEIQPVIKESLAKAPEGETDEAARKSQVDWIKSVQLYSEYSLYATAVASPPAVTVDLVNELEKLNPKSKYLNDAYGSYMVALNKTGAAAKVPAMAEKALANFPDNEDLLIFLADNAAAKRQNTAAVNYSNRLIAALNRHSKPENLSAAEWEKKKSAALGRAYWMVGVVAGEQNQYAIADKNLRSALPLIQGNDAMMGPALFYLGVSNYNIAKMTANKPKMVEAAKFSDQASKIAGPYQDQAWKNAALIQKEAAAMR